jgi:autotransporter-associated beta strand protein
VGTLNFSNSHSYTIAAGAGGALILDNGAAAATVNDSAGTHYITAPVILNSNAAITVSNKGDGLQFSGPISGAGGLSVAGAGSVTLAGSNSYAGNTTVSGTLIVASANSLPSNSSVTIQPGGKVQLASGIGQVSLKSLGITGSAALDIANNHLIINYPSGADPIASIAAMILSGYAGGAWTGNGIMSSTAASNAGSYGIGFADSADTGNPASLASNQIEIKYTLLGDANLDGKVNGADFAILATNFNKSVSGVSGWDQGDFNYDGKINGADFAFLASNFNKGASQSATELAALDSFAQANDLSLTSVPEPAFGTLALLWAGGLLAARRRPRSR